MEQHTWRQIQKAQELSTKLAETPQKMDQDIKSMTRSIMNLIPRSTGFTKKQSNVLEVQKEKDDFETQFHEIKEKADRASSWSSALQQKLVRTCQCTNEAPEAMM